MKVVVACLLLCIAVFFAGSVHASWRCSSPNTPTGWHEWIKHDYPCVTTTTGKHTSHHPTSSSGHTSRTATSGHTSNSAASGPSSGHSSSSSSSSTGTSTATTASTTGVVTSTTGTSTAQTSGVQTTGQHTTGERTTGVETTGRQTTGQATTGVQTTGQDTTASPTGGSTGGSGSTGNRRVAAKNTFYKGWVLPSPEVNGCPASPHNFTYWQNVGFQTSGKACGNTGHMQDDGAYPCVVWKTYNIDDSCSRAQIDGLTHQVWPSSKWEVKFSGGKWYAVVKGGGCLPCLKHCNLNNDTVCITQAGEEVCYTFSQEYADLVQSNCQARGLPDSWSCKPSSYGGGDGCQCFCGAWDPDCDHPEEQKTTDCSTDQESCIPPGICMETEELMAQRKQSNFLTNRPEVVV